MTCRPMETRARTMPIRPALGVIPPSIKSLHNSMRVAPPCCAATADATESTQTSISTCSAMGPVYQRSSREYRAFDFRFATARSSHLRQTDAEQSARRKEAPGLGKPPRSACFRAAFHRSRLEGVEQAEVNMSFLGARYSTRLALHLLALTGGRCSASRVEYVVPGSERC